MKKWLSLFAVLLLAACTPTEVPSDNARGESSENVSEEASDSAQESEKAASEEGSIALIFEKIKDAGLLGQTIQVSENNILNRYAIDTAELEDYIFEEPATSENADTLVIVKCKNADKADEIKKVLETQLENVKASTENYAPELYALYNKSMPETKGVYVYWIVSEKDEEIKTLLEEAISEQ